jgi:hypothetical protein
MTKRHVSTRRITTAGARIIRRRAAAICTWTSRRRSRSPFSWQARKSGATRCSTRRQWPRSTRFARGRHRAERTRSGGRFGCCRSRLGSPLAWHRLQQFTEELAFQEWSESRADLKLLDASDNGTSVQDAEKARLTLEWPQPDCQFPLFLVAIRRDSSHRRVWTVFPAAWPGSSTELIRNAPKPSGPSRDGL